MNRRSFLKKLITSTLSLIGLSGGTFFYAREVEPSLLTVNQETIRSPKIPKEFDQIKIAQFSDTHIGFHYTIEQLDELVNKMNKHQPDIVVFTGDLVDIPNTYKWGNQLVKSLSRIIAPLGRYWVYGNHDHGGYGTEIVKEAMDKSGFILLKNNYTTIERNGASFILAGLDDVMLGQPDISVIENVNANSFIILLVHEPDYAQEIKNYPVDVQLSGHSHGGQIQIPFYGYVYTPVYAEKYVEGKYTIGANPLQLYVSRGVGTTRLPYRFLCKPEITIYELKV